jgi:hypothetical protein
MSIITEKTDLDNIDTQVNTIVSQLNTINNTKKSFILTKTITRPANTIVYTAGQIINNVGNSSLMYFDFTTLGINGSRNIIIKEVQLTSNNNVSVNINLTLLSSQIIGTWIDGLLFNPSYANWNKTSNVNILLQLSSNTPSSIAGTSNLPNQLNYGATANTSLDINSFLYFALTTNAVLTPIASQVFDLTIKGIII